MDAVAVSTTLSILISSPRFLDLAPASDPRVAGVLRRRAAFRLRASIQPPVEVIGIGSRKDAVLDFCVAAVAGESRLRFWTVNSRDSQKAQLIQKSLGKDVILRDVEFPVSVMPCPPAVILVASAGHGSESITAMELLSAVKSSGGVTAAIILKPFIFEGQRRQEEVQTLVNKLRDCLHSYVVVEADSLLSKDVGTLAEALESKNRAALMAINTISCLISETNTKLSSTADGQIKQVRPPEISKLLGVFRSARVGFGASYDLKAAFKQAVFQCPFFTCSIKNSNGLIIVTLASASLMDEKDLVSVVLAFRQITTYSGEIIISKSHDPNLQPNLFVTTVLFPSFDEGKVSRKKSFLSDLVLHVPFLSSLLGGQSSSESNASNTHVGADLEALNTCPEEMETISCCKKETDLEGKESIDGSFTLKHESPSHINNGSNHEEPSNQDDQFAISNAGPAYHIAQRWARKRAAFVTSNNKLEKSTLAVGIKVSEWSQYSDAMLRETEYKTGVESSMIQTIPSKDAGLEATKDSYNHAHKRLSGTNIDNSRNQGALSARAASMLEAERESEKSWTPIVQMQYRGGTYKGRSQGGLPEGKGRLMHKDGSFYYGMWRYGKRWGLGTFCYSNGDVFQGVWRDDVMHGKGWFYFHTGDRWFANFWKGKANGDGRFYSKNGSISFGSFRNGWRQGKSLFIDADGLRWEEEWHEGVLVSRIQLNEKSGA